MKSYIWALEQLLEGVLVLDAYLIMKSLYDHEEFIMIVGETGKYSLKQMALSPGFATRRIDDMSFRVFFYGSPTGKRPFVTTMKCYIIDRLLQAILSVGVKKVCNIIDEIVSKEPLYEDTVF